MRQYSNIMSYSIQKANGPLYLFIRQPIKTYSVNEKKRVDLHILNIFGGKVNNICMLKISSNYCKKYINM